MSADPLGGDTTDPQTLNKYTYVRNNAANLIDSTGMYPEYPISDPCGFSCGSPSCGMFCGIVLPGLNPGETCPEGVGCEANALDA